MDNYDGKCICIHGICLFGADERIVKLLEENSLDNYADDIIGLVCTVNPLYFRTLYSILFWPEICFLCSVS